MHGVGRTHLPDVAGAGESPLRRRVLALCAEHLYKRAALKETHTAQLKSSCEEGSFV